MKYMPLISIFFFLSIGSALARPSHDGKRLIQISADDKGQWVDEATLVSLKQAGVNFMDITDHKFPIHIVPEDAIKGIPDKVQFQDVVKNAITHISSERTESFLVEFTNYFNRYYTADSGKESALWLLSEIEKSIVESRYNGTASGKPYSHSWLQPSIIATIEGSDPTLKNEIVILGAHLDSTAGGSKNRSPGADDDGSGSSVLLEAFRAILESNFIPKRTIEFQWYAAEEVGLRGSGDIAAKYSADKVNVVSMVNFDVVGYFKDRREIGITTDYTNAKLSEFIRLVVDAYADFKWKNRSCGYACSDHASFHRYGFPAAFPVEIVFSPYFHTTRDTISTLNFEQIKEFTKLAVGYAIEVSEPASSV